MRKRVLFKGRIGISQNPVQNLVNNVKPVSSYLSNWWNGEVAWRQSWFGQWRSVWGMTQPWSQLEMAAILTPPEPEWSVPWLIFLLAVPSGFVYSSQGYTYAWSEFNALSAHCTYTVKQKAKQYSVVWFKAVWSQPNGILRKQPPVLPVWNCMVQPWVICVGISPRRGSMCVR